MVSVIIGIIFLALIINVPTMIAYLIGLKFQITDPNCKDEVRDVKINIAMTKIIQVINVLLFVVILILIHFV